MAISQRPKNLNLKYDVLSTLEPISSNVLTLKTSSTSYRSAASSFLSIIISSATDIVFPQAILLASAGLEGFQLPLLGREIVAEGRFLGNVSGKHWETFF